MIASPWMMAQSFLEVDTAQFIEWNEDRPLQWSDYSVRATHATGESIFALTSVIHSVRGGMKGDQPNFQVKVLYVKKDSWTTTRSNTRLLEHERLHFDLAELYGRKLRKQIVSLGNQEEDRLSVYKKNIEALLDEFKSKSLAYDKETSHGRQEARQQEWQLFVRSELNRLNKYK